MKDKEIIDLYWRRSDAAIEETARKYGGYCHTIAYNILENFEDSEECVNDTWLGAWNSMPDKRPAKLAAFLGKITRNFAISRGIAKSREKRGGKAVILALEELDECIPDGFDLSAVIEARELELALCRFVRSLPETERQVFVSRYWYLDTELRIAKRQRFSKSKVSAMLKRTRSKLQTYLQEEGLCTVQRDY